MDITYKKKILFHECRSGEYELIFGEGNKYYLPLMKIEMMHKTITTPFFPNFSLLWLKTGHFIKTSLKKLPSFYNLPKFVSRSQLCFIY